MFSKPNQKQKNTAERCRSLPRSFPFQVAMLWTVFFYVILAAQLTALVAFLLNGDSLASQLSLWLTVTAVFTWLGSYLNRKRANCPLCKGTPLLDSRASPHSKAFRFFPLNYGTTNFLRIFFTRKFRCQFCGSPFDLLKVQSRE